MLHGLPAGRKFKRCSMVLVVSSGSLLILTPKKLQVITSGTGQEDRAPSNTGSKKGYCPEAFTAPG